MNAVRLIGLTACLGALAACSDSPTASPSADPRLAMSVAARAEAQRLYDRLNQESGTTYRPLMLKAIIDGLQWGLRIDTVTVTIGDVQQDMQAIAMDNVTTTPNQFAGFIMAWSMDPNVDTMLVVAKPYGASASTEFDEIGFYLAGGSDSPYVAVEGSAHLSFGALDPEPCVYETKPLLDGPPGDCNNEEIMGNFNLAFSLDGFGPTISIGSHDYFGVRIVREASFPSIAKLRDAAALLR